MADAEEPGPPFTQTTPVKDEVTTINITSPPMLNRKRKRPCDECTRLKEVVRTQAKNMRDLGNAMKNMAEEIDSLLDDQKKEREEQDFADVARTPGRPSLDLTFSGQQCELLPLFQDLEQLCQPVAPEELCGQARAERNKTRAKQLLAARAAESGTPPRHAAPSQQD